MRWRPARPWFGPNPRTGKIRPVSWPGSLVLFGGIALVAGLTRLGGVLPPLLLIALGVALTVAVLVVLAVTYGPPEPEHPRRPPRP